MKPREKSAPLDKPRTWRVWFLRKREPFLGFVDAPDRAAAEAAAVLKFNLNADQRKRLMICERRD
jgi:hypothetical protein